VFLPPIGGSTVYIFGDPAKIPDENTPLTVRVHDECNGGSARGRTGSRTRAMGGDRSLVGDDEEEEGDLDDDDDDKFTT
jgi:hypothetical protein